MSASRLLIRSRALLLGSVGKPRRVSQIDMKQIVAGLIDVMRAHAAHCRTAMSRTRQTERPVLVDVPGAEVTRSSRPVDIVAQASRQRQTRGSMPAALRRISLCARNCRSPNHGAIRSAATHRKQIGPAVARGWRKDDRIDAASPARARQQFVRCRTARRLARHHRRPPPRARAGKSLRDCRVDAGLQADRRRPARRMSDRSSRGGSAVTTRIPSSCTSTREATRTSRSMSRPNARTPDASTNRREPLLRNGESA